MQKLSYKKGTLALSLATGLSLLLGACSGGGATKNAEAEDPGEKGFSVADIKADPNVEALVPAEMKKAGVLKDGAALDYPPADYKKADGQTPTGYDTDLVAAIAKKMGLKEAQTSHSEFDSLIPKIGKQFDIGVSSFTITKERLAQFNMIAYATVGFQYGVPKGNPGNFDPKDVCGKSVGVQTGTAQEEAIQEISKKCEKDGKPAVKIGTHKSQAEVTQKVVGKQYDATLADSPVVGYAIKKSNGQLEKAGEVFDTAQHGIVVPKDNQKLAEAITAAVNSLIKDGTLKKLFAHYGAEDLLLKEAVLNPATDN